MSGFLPYAVVLLGMIVLIGFFNEKVTKLTNEIALMLLTVPVGILVTVAAAFVKDSTVRDILGEFQIFDLEEFLMKGVLCFMLFAGSCHLNFKRFRKNWRPISVLAFFCTLLGAVFYGALFYLIAFILKLPLSIPVCLMFGSIVAPTDPIAATGILKKFGLPSELGFLIESESLLNDGVGVALFVCFSGMVSAEGGGGFFRILFREILGAVIIGTLVTFLLFRIFKGTEDGKRKIFVSLFSVGLSYFLCEHFSCSGAIASVVCGVLFATFINREEERGAGMELEEFFGFWEILDNLLNSALYVILGFSFVRILQMSDVLILSVAAILCNLIARFVSLYCGTFLLGPIPDGYDRMGFTKLLTWGGLRGGLSIALAMSTKPFLEAEVFYIILGCTYAIVFFTTVVQGLSMKKVYDRIERGLEKG